MSKRYSIKIREPIAFDLRTIMPKLRALGLLHDEKTIALLADLMPLGRHLEFVLQRHGLCEVVRVLCPVCHLPRSYLTMVEGDLACRGCNLIRAPSRCARRSTFDAHIGRPLARANLLMRKLRAPGLTDRQRRITRNKLRKLLDAIPLCLFRIFEESEIPLPAFADALSQLL